MAAVRDNVSTVRDTKLGIAWVAFRTSFMPHVTDEALTGFLPLYNPSVVAVRQTIPLFPMPFSGFETGPQG
ncbi:MAG TPA: hypothetical protein VNH83_27330 [Bryobacteraceae bacterium]|nr:hypothetical protein [Bryobacteraceae bacterium]